MWRPSSYKENLLSNLRMCLKYEILFKNMTKIDHNLWLSQYYHRFWIGIWKTYTFSNNIDFRIGVSARRLGQVSVFLYLVYFTWIVNPWPACVVVPTRATLLKNISDMRIEIFVSIFVGTEPCEWRKIRDINNPTPIISSIYTYDRNSL